MENILNQIVVIMLNISLWQGRKKLRAEDLIEKGIDPESLPPEKLASLGSKRVISTDAVNLFMALKRRAERTCLSVGVRCLGGYGIPEDKLDSVRAELEEIKVEFAAEKKAFLDEYEVTVDAWAAENPEWETAIRRAIDPKEVVDAQLQCGYTVFKFAPAKGAEETLSEEVKGLHGQLSREIAQAAKTAWDTTFKGKLQVTRKALSSLRNIMEKLQGLSFLDGSVGALAQSAQTVIKQSSGKTPIDGVDLMAINGLLATLMGLDRMRFNSEVEAAELAAMPDPELEPEVEAEVSEAPAQQDLVHVVEPPLAPVPEDLLFTYKPPVQDTGTFAPAGWF